MPRFLPSEEKQIMLKDEWQEKSYFFFIAECGLIYVGK